MNAILENGSRRVLPLWERVLRLLAAAGLLAYVRYAFLRDDFVMPTKKGSMHLHGLSAWLMELAVILFSVALVAAVVQHYRQTKVESSFGLWAGKLCLVLMGLSFGALMGGDRLSSTIACDAMACGDRFVLRRLFWLHLLALGEASSRTENDAARP